MTDNNSYPIRHNSKLEDATNWYRNLGPNTDINDVPLEEHADAIASSVLEILGYDLPDGTYDRYLSFLEHTNDIRLESLGSTLALEGSGALALADILLEFTERDTPDITNNERIRLLEIDRSMLVGIRENPSADHNVKIAANAKLSNVMFAQLDLRRRLTKMSDSEYSKEYISIVRTEARWFAGNTVGAKTGDLFESYITVLARQAAWDKEVDTDVSIRHATMRQDQPNKRVDGGKGHAFAHDIHITTSGGPKYIQCKHGSGADEHKDYDPQVIIITETCDDGYLQYNSQFKEAFEALFRSDRITNMDQIEEAAKRYNLEKIIKHSVLVKAATTVTKMATD